MRDFHVRFCLDRSQHDGLIDLLNDEKVEDELPQTGGADVLGTSATMLTYPWGTSPIFYVGNGRITCAEARRHGITPVPRSHPAYRYMRDGDGDGDGVVCE